MRIRSLLLLLCLPGLLPAQERCGVAKDMTVRVRERLATGTSAGEYGDLLQLLKQANQLCTGQGDAWYLRSLLEGKLGRANMSTVALNKARLFGSEMMQMELNPVAPPPPPQQAPPVPAEPTQIGRKWALVIGISKFQDNRIPALRFTAKDAGDVATLLTDGRYGRFPKENVRLLMDQQATTVNIKSELNWLARNAGPDDLVVIYFSSHGSPREMDTAGVSYVVTYDTSIDSPDTLYATALPMVDIADAVRTRLKAQRAVVILDTCYSGGATAAGSRDIKFEKAGIGVSGETVKALQQGKGRVIITSSSANEKSWESDAFGNGIFTHYLLEGLKQKDGLVPIDQAFGYTREHVIQTVQEQKHTTQTPTISKSDEKALIVLGVPPR